MSADADRRRYCVHCGYLILADGECINCHQPADPGPPASSDADRIAQLTAELAEARADIETIKTALVAAAELRNAERAGHERTKAELAEARELQIDVRCTIESWCKLEAERDAAIAREQAAQADAAGMVVRFKSLLTESARLTGREGEAWLPFVLMLIDQVAAESPGRALAARASLLEGIAEGLKIWRDGLDVKRSRAEKFIFEEIVDRFPALDELAALDAQETK